jgi:hypothetical protein
MPQKKSLSRKTFQGDGKLSFPNKRAVLDPPRQFREIGDYRQVYPALPQTGPHLETTWIFE